MKTAFDKDTFPNQCIKMSLISCIMMINEKIYKKPMAFETYTGYTIEQLENLRDAAVKNYNNFIKTQK